MPPLKAVPLSQPLKNMKLEKGGFNYSDQSNA
jgi:hypothetical protein